MVTRAPQQPAVRGAIGLSAKRQPQGSKLLWSLRSYAWVVVACVLALAAAPLIVAPTPTYEADALVFARQLNIPQQILPRLAEAVFANGAVSAAVSENPDTADKGSGLIPERLSVVAAEDSIVVVVQARDSEPAAAANLANVAAAAFVEELNRSGAGVGEFALENEAIVPTEPLSQPPPQTRSAVGALAGLILGLGLVGLIAVARRPVVTARDVGEVAGVPLLGTVQLPLVSAGDYPGPLGVSGIATVTRWLATVPAGRLLVVSPPTAVAIRHRIYVMCGVALWTLRPVRFEAPDELVDAIRSHCMNHRDAGRVVHAPPGAVDELVLVDRGSALEVVDPTVTTVSVVAVAPVGVSRRRLHALTSDYAGNGLVGVVLVDVRQGLKKALTLRGRPAAEDATAPEDRQASDVPEAERA
jgi:hypothetical protein